MSAEEDLGVVFIEGTLVVADGRHVLDDDCVVRVLALLVQDGVGLNHVIHNVGLGDLLGTELPLGAQVLAVIVAEVVVTRDRRKPDACVDEEINQRRLHLCLSRFEVVTADEGTMLRGKFNGTWYECVLRRAIDERHLFKDASHGKDSGGRDLLVAILNGLE